MWGSSGARRLGRRIARHFSCATSSGFEASETLQFPSADSMFSSRWAPFSGRPRFAPRPSGAAIPGGRNASVQKMDDQPTTRRLGTGFASSPRASVTIRAICATGSRPSPRTNERPPSPSSHPPIPTPFCGISRLCRQEIFVPGSRKRRIRRRQFASRPDCAAWRRGFRGPLGSGRVRAVDPSRAEPPKLLEIAKPSKTGVARRRATQRAGPGGTGASRRGTARRAWPWSGSRKVEKELYHGLFFSERK
jgi:hypothetical protein